MHLNGTAVRARHQAGRVSPVISGREGWLGDSDRDQPLTVQLTLPVSAEELVAALYGDQLRGLCPDDLAEDQNVWGFAALVIVECGLGAIRRQAAEIETQEALGTVANPQWLAECRRRVTEVTGYPIPFCSLRCRAGDTPPSITRTHRSRTPGYQAPPPTGRTGLAWLRTLAQAAVLCLAGR